MKIRVVCDACLTESMAEVSNTEGTEDDSSSQDIEGFAELGSDGIVNTQCSRGHSGRLFLRAHLFEVLFDVSLMAYTDGYRRETISGIAATYERFVELIVRVILSGRGVTGAGVADCWKEVARQSERQLGAFLLLYLSEFGTAPRVLCGKSIALRNQVTHNGYIPHDLEVEEYASDVLAAIRETVGVVAEKYRGHFQKVRLEAEPQHVAGSPRPIGYTYPTAICLSAALQLWTVPDFASAVAHVEKFRDQNYLRR